MADLGLRVGTVLRHGGDLALLASALIAAALACVAGLALGRGSAGALVAAGAASSLAALDVVGIAQAERLTVGAVEWRPWLAVAELGLLGAAGVAGTAAGSVADRAPGRWPGVVVALAIVGIVGVGIAAVVTIALVPASGVDGHADPATIRLSGRAALALAGAALTLALALLVRQPILRARSRALAGGAEVGTTERLRRFGWALAHELPGRSDRDRVAEEERARLAADIHAQLLPGLRRAAWAAAAAGVPATVAEDLRAAVSDAETLMDLRESVVLEQGGLVAALELLAERTEDRSGLEVELDLDGAPDPVDLSPAIARVALRVAILAVENSVRHARGTRIAIGLRHDPGGMCLRVSDDGVGLDAAKRNPMGRGLRDMAAEARRIGGTIDVTSGTPGVAGTRVDLCWPVPARPENHATKERAFPDGGTAANG